MRKFIDKFNYPSNRMLITWLCILIVGGGIIIPVMGNYVGIFTYPDNTFFLTYSKLHAYISELGVDGIERYAVTKYSLDVVWPFIYIMYLTILINYLRRFIKMESYITVLAICSFVFDMLENLYFASYLTNHGSVFIGYIGITCYYIKWISLFALICILIYKNIVYLKSKRNLSEEIKEKE